MKNQIIIKNLEIFAYHGVHESEKKIGQKFIVDITITTCALKGYQSDNINDVLSYSDAIKAIKNVLTERSYNLIEKAAENVSKKLFETFDEILEIELILKKPEAPINENFDFVGVKIFRKKSDYNE